MERTAGLESALAQSRLDRSERRHDRQRRTGRRGNPHDRTGLACLYWAPTGTMLTRR
jgi:hypothetical protein